MHANHRIPFLRDITGIITLNIVSRKGCKFDNPSNIPSPLRSGLERFNARPRFQLSIIIFVNTNPWEEVVPERDNCATPRLTTSCVSSMLDVSEGGSNSENDRPIAVEARISTLPPIRFVFRRFELEFVDTEAVSESNRLGDKNNLE
jgi:hypothetical protein